MRMNASAHESAGLRVTVTRVYDGVGLSNGRTCQWCLDRFGEDMTYQEAYDKGAFQRHPGCGCELYYKTGKRVQRQTDWTKNKWTDETDSKQIAVRRAYGVKNPPSNEKELLRLARDGNTYVVKTEKYYSYSKKIQPIEGFVDIVGHGDPFSMVFRDANGNETNVSAVEFSKIMDKGGFYKGGNIRLVACQTGREPAIVAHFLADKYGVQVMVPTEIVNVDFEGNIILADDEEDAKMGIETGEWVIIEPRGKQ